MSTAVETAFVSFRSGVYAPLTQPAHEEFPLDWTAPRQPGTLSRAVFIASRQPLDHPLLTTELPDRQRAC